MTRFGLIHLIMLFVTALFLVLTSYAVSKMRRKWQNVMFALAAIIPACGVAFRYLLGLNFDLTFDFEALLLQMLQVYNFNLILMPLVLISRLHLAQQYSIYFSMLVSALTLITVEPELANHSWHDPLVLVAWISQTFAVACPLWMMAAKRARPERKYIIPVAICVFFYFTVVYLISEALIGAGVITPDKSFSFIYDTTGVPIMSTLHKLIPVPYFHLYPLFPVLVGFFVLFSLPFNKKLYFNSNGGEGAIKERVVPIHSLTQLPWRGMTRAGYRQIGWSSDSQARTPEYDTGGGYIMGTSDTMLYAVWEPWGVQKKADVEDHKHYYEQTWGVSCDECIMKDGCESFGNPNAMCEARIEQFTAASEDIETQAQQTRADYESEGVDFESLNKMFLSGAAHSVEVAEPTDEELAAMNPDFNNDDE